MTRRFNARAHARTDRHRVGDPHTQALASHYLLEPCFCRPGEGHDKGGERALAEGLPYQTLIASLLHKYATGRLKEV